ncbi:hypothetical protein E2C01_009032 [Portunus trituberculatus]|uniref:Uncharacterized protein n=1 Tax=Portunus trituberculatus TaxID=210409 RepID=A0A5B7D2C9_PORTR|nr:hypothetical protein [Portunus trituberculatus]
MASTGRKARLRVLSGNSSVRDARWHFTTTGVGWAPLTSFRVNPLQHPSDSPDGERSQEAATLV